MLWQNVAKRNTTNGRIKNPGNGEIILASAGKVANSKNVLSFSQQIKCFCSREQTARMNLMKIA